MQSGIDADSARAILLLLAAAITLLSAILNITHAQAKEAATPEAKREVYRNVLGWLETALWAGGLPAYLFLGEQGLDLSFALWISGFILGCGLFLTSQDSKRLRVEIFRLVFSSQAIVLLWVMASESRLLSLFGRLLDVMAPN